ncbi:MAG: CDP-diacylglycerol--serine O-phosphatidyltransferase [Bacteroidales bacterium]|jgi:CDP-diacylglycerol--serine O-phosphatidyltransferase|nr:CDP-diacylglycerol--serine O-phosphatidyltransferase [Bacteroidales bacterium]
MIKRQIPNIITLCNLLCGVFAIITLGNGTLQAPCFIILGAILDFFDGMVARLLKVEGMIGKELDSLADVVTFGVAPALIALTLLMEQLGCMDFPLALVALIPLSMALMSAYRLAKFNIDTRQTTSFLGVPTPLNALLWLSIPIIAHLSLTKQHLWGWYGEGFYRTIASVLTNEWFIIVGSVLMSVFMVIEIPMLALKFKNMKWQDNKERFLFIIISLALIFVLNVYAVPFVVIIYILISIISNIVKR